MCESVLDSDIMYGTYYVRCWELWLTRWLWRVSHIGAKYRKTANALISNARAIITTPFRTETTACYAVVDVVVVVIVVVSGGGVVFVVVVVNGTAAIVVFVVVVTVEQRKIEYRSARASLDSTHKWIMCLGESRTGEARVIFLVALSNILHSHHALHTRQH